MSILRKGEGAMISNQILQSNIEGLKEITRIDLCVCDVEEGPGFHIRACGRV